MLRCAGIWDGIKKKTQRLPIRKIKNNLQASPIVCPVTCERKQSSLTIQFTPIDFGFISPSVFVISKARDIIAFYFTVTNKTCEFLLSVWH